MEDHRDRDRSLSKKTLETCTNTYIVIGTPLVVPASGAIGTSAEEFALGVKLEVTVVAVYPSS